MPVKVGMKPARKEHYLDWIEIMSGPEMAAWIHMQTPGQWVMVTKGLYWLHPELYVWWKLKYR